MPKKNGSSNGDGKAGDHTTLPQSEAAPNSPAFASHTALPALRHEEESVALLMERDPARYAKCVDLLEAGLSPGGVAALTRVPLVLVRKVRSLIGEPVIIAGIRAVGRNLVEASQLMSERLCDEAGEIPIHALPAALGVIVDRANLLAGGATMRVEHSRAVPSRADLERMFNDLPQANAALVTPDATTPEKKQVSAPSHTAFPAGANSVNTIP